ncbi:hypothetical protein B0I35DRAFT_435663 [Stachybotrys elegans]|uniref:Uncharacterized protein n=1 Tax=Stachybotrys elegans TaxID=80388 RepID=A0A8K0SS24_9HYPO|nr:hypothetical protein B0I35DRAFT_435663 [Stachybotrys elegans]
MEEGQYFCGGVWWCWSTWSMFERNLLSNILIQVDEVSTYAIIREQANSVEGNGCC